MGQERRWIEVERRPVKERIQNSATHGGDPAMDARALRHLSPYTSIDGANRDQLLLLKIP